MKVNTTNSATFSYQKASIDMVNNFPVAKLELLL